MTMPGCKTALFDGRSVAQALLRESRTRARHFDADLLCDPAWELLLHLYDAETAQRVCATREMQRGTSMSAGTLKRWIRLLERRGLVTIIADTDLHEDGLVKLTQSARRAMDAYLLEIAQRDPDRF